MKVVDPVSADVVKAAVDSVSSFWRQVRTINEAEMPAIIAVKIEGRPTVVAAGTGMQAFGSGHLSIGDWWHEGGQGAAVKTATQVIDQIGEEEIFGFIHFHRSVIKDRNLNFQAGLDSPIASVVRFFEDHPEEYSAFVPVVFRRQINDRYPWRAMPQV